MEEIWFRGQKKIIIKKLIKCAIIFLFIGLFIGVGLGMAWRIKQVEPEKDAKIQAQKKIIENYQKNWTPIRPGRKK